MKTTASFTLCCLLFTSLVAQMPALDEAQKKSSIEALCKNMEAQYVFEDVAKSCTERLQSELKSGHFAEVADWKAFAEALTVSLQAVSKDKHIRVRLTPAARQAANGSEPKKEVAPPTAPDHLTMLAEYRREQDRRAGGFAEARILENNIGYIDIRGFAQPNVGAPVADAYMALVKGCDALIIDLRRNGGGSPRMVQYLCSYFFTERVHLNSLYYREGERTEEFWTVPVKGQIQPNLPLFILTSDYTFSGAEEFSYNMQTRKRATIVGDTTGGGANPGSLQPINEVLEIFVPNGRAINPITKTNWEGTGVRPDVLTSSEESLAKATELAVAAGKTYRSEQTKQQERLFDEIRQPLAQLKKTPTDAEAEKKLLAAFQKAIKEGILDEEYINFLGYEYLLHSNDSQTAELVFKANTQLFPQSANAQDSYAGALLQSGKQRQAVQYYEKAVLMGREQKDPLLPIFKENLKKAKEESAKSKTKSQ